MKIFSQENKCDKCGAGASIHYNNEDNCIDRVCNDCSFKWSERPIDSVSTEEKTGLLEDDRDLLEG